MNTIEMRNDGRFISHHGNGVDVYFDSRHKIIKSHMEGGCWATLVMGQDIEGHRRAQMLTPIRFRDLDGNYSREIIPAQWCIGTEAADVIDEIIAECTAVTFHSVKLFDPNRKELIQ